MTEAGPVRWERGAWQLLPPLAMAAAAVACNGYRFGTSDQAIHLTLLRRLLEPGSLSRDLVAEHGASHASLWWHLQVPAVRALGWDALPALYAVLYAVALTATFWLLWRIARELFAADPWVALLAPALLVVFKACPAHVRTFEPELINRTVAHPLVLAAVWQLLRGNPLRAGALCGLALDLHASSASHAAVACLAAAVADRRLWRQLPAFVGAAALCGAPLGLYVAAGGGPSAWWVDAEWMEVLRWRMPHHLLPWRWPPGAWVAAAVQLALWVWASRGIADPAVRRRAHGMVAGVLLCGPVLGTLVAGPLPVAPLLALHLWEAWLLLAVLAYLAAAGPVLAALRDPRWTRRLAGGLLLVALLVGVEGWTMGRGPRPGVQLTAPRGPEAALVEALARLQVPGSPGDLVIVSPTGLSWLRAATGRSLWVTVKDGGEAVFDRELALAWRQRLADQCGTDVLAGDPPPGEWRGYRAVGQAAEEAFAVQDTASLRALATRERAWLLIVRAEQARADLEPAYGNERYVVYDLRQLPQAGAAGYR